MRPGGIIEVPQISRIHTDIFSETYAGWGNEWVTQMTQMTQIFSSIIPYPQMRPIRSDDAEFPRPFGSPYRGQKPKGLAVSAYAIKLYHEYRLHSTN